MTASAFLGLLEAYGGTVEALPADTFAAEGTGVQTVLVCLTRAAPPVSAEGPTAPPGAMQLVLC